MEKTKKKLFNKVEWSWIFYDWANSIWATNIAAAIFPIYFAMKASETGNAIYGYAVSIANLLVAVMAPYLGAIGDFLALFTPDFFKTVPVGEFAGQVKYWPWFWMICPVYILVTPLSFLLCLVFERKSLKIGIKGKKKAKV